MMKKLLIFTLLILPLFAISQTIYKTANGEVFTKVKQMPQFPGGEEKLYEFLSNNIRYPEKMKKENIEARVIVTFIVNKKGEISDINVVNTVPDEFAAETKRVIEIMPNWIPGKVKRKPVSVLYTLPIRFKLT